MILKNISKTYSTMKVRPLPESRSSSGSLMTLHEVLTPAGSFLKWYWPHRPKIWLRKRWSTFIWSTLVRGMIILHVWPSIPFSKIRIRKIHKSEHYHWDTCQTWGSRAASNMCCRCWKRVLVTMTLWWKRAVSWGWQRLFRKSRNWLMSHKGKSRSWTNYTRSLGTQTQEWYAVCYRR